MARQLADANDGVVSRSMLRRAGITRRHVAFEVAAERWTVHGDVTVAVHTRPLSRPEQLWHAVWEVGDKVAALDGVTALHHAGLTGYQDDAIHLSVVHTARVKAPSSVTLHKVIRRIDGELAGGGMPHTRPSVAAIRGAQWAVSDRQAALILLLTVQQRLTTPELLLEASRQIRGRRRRGFVRQVVRDIALGVQSLGELDFAVLCRERGLPEPDRQVVVETNNGRIYLDVRWRNGLCVEIDGVQHREALMVSTDNLRTNDLVLGGDRALRIDLVGLRVFTDQFLAQVARGLTQYGWQAA
ncbi:hypothetical protein FHX52_4428 [Humibacillus xanthopallidus]|uniref:DUF559 domain-containing protein n=1 Tax=Humibacillus xanthopallidus TaxID=412689 RepID=A0A543PM86_9MICO|nr:hypothetical protein [Humibacillus xanthopallidus]TQN45192.1 hypothetical protein FHX52_4428 [Humibacillus xanthopallidus]